METSIWGALVTESRTLGDLVAPSKTENRLISSG